MTNRKRQMTFGDKFGDKPKATMQMLQFNFWCKVSKRFNLSKSSRNDQAYQLIAKKLAVPGIHRTSNQCREWIRRLRIDYWKARDETCTSGYSPSSCPFYEEFDWELSTALSTEPPALHDSLVSQESDLPPLNPGQE
ncbi:unnamed protein product [Caretta caretta]